MDLHTLLPSPSVVIEICSALRSPYPAGYGSAAIFRSMPANSRRDRWLSASTNQELRACRMSRPPVLANRCCNLVSDPFPIGAGSASRRSTSWKLTINQSREEIEDLTEQSPSLRNVLDEPFASGKPYSRALRNATVETEGKITFRCNPRGLWTSC
ncbi:MAG TPA: DUF29 family protein [Candidatus Binataceae bacterium]|nr:DUF29 family protein [Candidatus Binataceae bacterium]